MCTRIQETVSPSPDGNRLYLGLEHLAQGFPALVGRGKESEVRSNKIVFHKNDVLFGKLRPYLRKSVLADEDGICSTDILALRATEQSIPKFLCYLTHADEFIDHAKATTSGVRHPRTSWDSLRTFRLHVPPISEQRKIAAVLGLVQRAIEEQDRLIQLTTELKKSLLQKLFTEGLHGEPQKMTEIGPVPESWKSCRLDKIVTLHTGGTPRRDVGDYWMGGNIPWVKTAEINYHTIQTTEEVITQEGLNNSAAKVFPTGTLLVAMYGQGITRGRVAILGIAAATNQACAAIMPINEREISTMFIYYFLEYHYEDLRQMGHGANQKNLNMALIRGFRIAYPSLEEQRMIIEPLTCADCKLEQTASRRRKLAALFQSLLHNLMTARVRVHNLSNRRE
jgi:type I restriction enzyme S subunit